MTRLNNSSRPNTWASPRPHRDASTRFAKHGPILGMDEPTIWQRVASVFKGQSK